jgi:hypothetical protein
MSLSQSPIKLIVRSCACLIVASAITTSVIADEKNSKKSDLFIEVPGLFKSIKNPKCSYCNVQHKKGFVDDKDQVVAWLRSSHGGGAIPIRHFLSATRVINDTYGIFFFDPDGGFVSAFERSQGYQHTYEFHGWRNGVMIVKSNDGSLVSALSGEIFAGPRKGERLKPIASMVTNWKFWLDLHPDSVAYRLYEGKTFIPTALPVERTKRANESMGKVDGRAKPLAKVIGVRSGNQSKAYQLDRKITRQVVNDSINGQDVAVFWYGPTQSAVAFSATLDKQKLTFIVDEKAPDSAPFEDKETGSNWTLSGRAVDGKLKGKELKWVDSLQSNWYAWSSEYPQTVVYKKR